MTADFSIIGGSELVIISAENDTKLVEEITRLVTFIDRIPDCSLVDVAYTCSLMRGESVIALVASSVQDLRDRLSSAKSRLESGTATRLKDKSGTYYFRDHLLGEGRGKLAFVYPSAISFYPDMMRDLVVLHPECRAPFDELEEALKEEPGFTPSNFIFPPASYYRHDADIFSSGAYAQALVATYAGCVAMSRFLDASGIKPDGVVGCGGGDLVAAMKSGVAAATSRPERVKALREIYKIVSKAVDNKGLPKIVMVTVMVRHEEDLESVLATFPKKKVYLVSDFSPKMKTVAIDPEFEEMAMKAFANAGIRTLKLELNRPFNTPNCASIVPAIKKFATEHMKHKGVYELYSCATADKLSDSPRAARNDIAERWAKPVLFAQTIRKMHDDGYRVFVEVGPRGIMTGAIEETLTGRHFAAIALNSIHRRSLLQAQHALAQLAALGAKIDISGFFVRRRATKLDFDATLSMEFRTVIERKLSRAFPKMTLLGESSAANIAYTGEPKTRGTRAAERAAAKAARESSRLQFAAGTTDPLISDAPPTESIPGVSYEFTKLFKISDVPFIADFAYGVSQLSYSDPNLRGLVLLPIPLAVEIMAETAQRVVPNRVLIRIEDFVCRRRVAFSKASLKLTVKAERVSPADPTTAAVKVQIRDDTPDAQFTWPLMEANFIMATERLEPTSCASIEPLAHPRSVHWSGRDIYPSKLGFGSRLRGIVFAENWAESGINYEVEVPSSSGSVTFTLMPSWTVNPLLLQIITSGFMLWRCHEKFTGAFSFPFRFRRLELKGAAPKEGSRLNCYLRLTGVTPRSHLCDITVTGGNGNVVMEIDGWEEITERVPKDFCDMVLQPATSFISDCVPSEVFGDPGTDVASAVITDVPYPMFERNEELWLKILSNVVLNAPERREAAKMKGSVARRTEWLFGRIAVKEAVRRYLKNFHQARWSYADVQIWPNENGKPQAIGAWGDNLTSKLDVAIAHTSQFVIALAASNAKVGVDVESVARNLSEEFTYGVFSPEELELATKAANSSQAIIRFWCAKEAVSKALGTGIRYSPKEMVITDYLPDSGNITMRLTGAWVEVFKNFTGRDIPVTTRIVKDHALAFSFIPASLFNEN